MDGRLCAAAGPLEAAGSDAMWGGCPALGTGAIPAAALCCPAAKRHRVNPVQRRRMCMRQNFLTFRIFFQSECHVQEPTRQAY